MASSYCINHTQCISKLCLGRGRGAYVRPMVIARRDLLRVGAAVAASVALSSCSSARPDSAPVATRAPRPTPTTPAAPTPVATGPAHLPRATSTTARRSRTTGRSPAWEKDLGTTLALNRSYFTPTTTRRPNLVRRCRDDLAHGRLPHVSIKPPATWRESPAARSDDWLTEHAASARRRRRTGLPHPAPRARERRRAGRACSPPTTWPCSAARSSWPPTWHRRSTIVPVLQHWTFDPVPRRHRPGRLDRARGVRDRASTSTTPGRRRTARRGAASAARPTRCSAGSATPRLAIGEYGCREDPENPGLAAEWLRDAADYARTHNIVSMSYFNSGVDVARRQLGAVGARPSRPSPSCSPPTGWPALSDALRSRAIRR